MEAEPERCCHGRQQSFGCKICDLDTYLFCLLQSHNKRVTGTEEGTLVNLGCSVKCFRKWIEQQWENWMTWETHGRGAKCWQLDHIVPLKIGGVEALHYKNLRPLDARENRCKWAMIRGIERNVGGHKLSTFQRPDGSFDALLARRKDLK